MFFCSLRHRQIVRLDDVREICPLAVACTERRRRYNVSLIKSV
jgi:hypothetical protein